MAELLGTVVGVVSLGLQVCSGITKYLDGIKGHKDEIASASRLCLSLQGAVDQIQAMRNNIATASRGHDTAIEQAMMAANAELEVLRMFVDDIRVNEDPSKSISEWIKDRTNRVAYPFRRGHLDRLESQLSEANNALQSAIQATQLYIVCEIVTRNDKLTAFSAISIETVNVTRSIGDKVTTTRTELNTKLDNLQQVSTDGDLAIEGKLSDGFSHLSLSLDKFVPQAQQHMEASSVHFTRMERKIEDVVSALISLDPQICFRRVLTKPDALRLMCREAGIDQHSSGSLNSLHTAHQDVSIMDRAFCCRCKPRQMRKRTQRSFRLAFVTAENLVKRVHSPDCPLAEIAPLQKSWSFGVSTNVFRTLLSAAITVTMSSTSGAGGFSICPMFRMNFMRGYTPAEAIIDTIQNSIHLQDESFSLVLQKGIRALQWIFKSGKASPLDVNRSNQNLLNYACEWPFIFSAFHMWRLRPLLSFLVALGVPKDHLGHMTERLPFHFFFERSAFLFYWHDNSTFNADSPYKTFTTMSLDHLFLMPDDVSIISDYSLSSNITTEPMTLAYYQQIARSLPKMGEWYGNSLHTAIIRRDEVQLVKVLEEDTAMASLLEHDTFGYTTLELLASWTRGIELVLLHWGKHILQTDHGRRSMLCHALVWGGEICSVSSTARCPDTCLCADNVVMLLKAGCLIHLDFHLVKYVLKASMRCQEAMIGHLKKRREELAYLALNRLSPTEIKGFGISTDTVLDIKTHEVVHALKRRNVEVPQLLQTQVVNHDTLPPWSLYHLISRSNTSTDTRHLLNIIHSHGFGGLDVLDATGFAPSMMTSSPLTFINLVKMGADPTRQIPGSVAGFTTTHHLFEGLGSFMAREKDIEMMIEVKEHIQLSHAFPSEDSCICECTVNGCHPYSATCKTVLRRDGCYDNDWSKELDVLIGSIANVSDGVKDLPEDFKLIAVRMATFVSLSIRHTCCDSDGKATVIDDDDVQQFREEDSRAIKILHGLLPEFEMKLAEANCSVSEFMATVWKSRMEQVLADFYEPHNLTEDNMREILGMGVNLQVQDEDESEDELFVNKPLEYHVAELDKIMEEIDV